MSSVLGLDRGRWRTVVSGWELTFERRLRHPPARVWQALTTPTGLRAWLAAAEIEPRAGGRMYLRFEQTAVDDFPDTEEMRQQRNEILTWRPFTLFEHSFGGPDSIVSWRLASAENGTHLTLVHCVPRRWESDLPRTLSGWHHHLERLSGSLLDQHRAWDWRRWKELRTAYTKEMER